MQTRMKKLYVKSSMLLLVEQCELMARLGEIGLEIGFPLRLCLQQTSFPMARRAEHKGTEPGPVPGVWAYACGGAYT